MWVAMKWLRAYRREAATRQAAPPLPAPPRRTERLRRSGLAVFFSGLTG
jgi:hypothetical protein